LDDPSHRAPPPYGMQPRPVDPYPQPQVPSLPGMPPVPMMPPPGMGGVSVHIQNVAPMPYPPAYPQAPYPPPQPHHQPGVVDMIRNDANQRAMEAVARRGPVRVLAYVVAGLSSLALLVAISTLFLGAAVAPVMFAALPLTAIVIASLVVASRAGRGVAHHHLEQAILRHAAENAGVVRVVALARDTGHSLLDCQTAIDAMVHAGHATVEADDSGSLLYRIPDLAPQRPMLVAEVVHTATQTERGR